MDAMDGDGDRDENDENNRVTAASEETGFQQLQMPVTVGW